MDYGRFTQLRSPLGDAAYKGGLELTLDAVSFVVNDDRPELGHLPLNRRVATMAAVHPLQQLDWLPCATPETKGTISSNGSVVLCTGYRAAGRVLV
jgi:hypothetical protein